MARSRGALVYIVLVISLFAILVKVFQVKKLEIVGNVLANEGKIRRVIGQLDLLWVDLDQVKEDILEDNLIKDASITIVKPSYAIIKLEELKPIANIDLDGALLQVASDGTILTVGEYCQVPTIKGLASFPYLPSKKIPHEITGYLKIVEATSDLGLAEIICTSSGVTLKMQNKSEVFLGKNYMEPELIRQKIKEITMRGQHKYIDLSQKGYARGL